MNSVQMFKALRLASIDYRAVSKSDALSKRCVRNILELCGEFGIPDSAFISKLRTNGISELKDQDSFISLYKELVEHFRELLKNSDKELMNFLREMRPAYELDLPIATVRKLYSKQVNQMVEELLW